MPFNPETATHPITRTLVTNQPYDLQDIDHDAIVNQINTSIQAIDQNAADITAANADIQKNTSDIETANTAIQKNASDIETANTAIQKNASDIETANTAIQKNASDIETANTAIQKNADDIAKISIDPLTIYPIGSIYMSVNNTSPATLFGGTWEQIKDMFLLSAGDTYAAGSTGGSANHSHKYAVSSYRYFGTNVGSDVDGIRVKDYLTNELKDAVAEVSESVISNNAMTNSTTTVSSVNAISEGNTESGSNMPPYLAVYCWKRTA